MKIWILGLALAAMIISGCTTMGVRHKGAYNDELYGSALMSDRASAELNDAASDRMLIWTGSLTIEVQSITNATQRVLGITTEMGGYIESSSSYKHDNGRASTTIKLRIPSGKLEATLGGLEGIGEVTEKSLSSDDVTERYIDTEARLKTKKQLRDRLQKLLDKADVVKDVLAIERELNRLQADIDSKEALLKSMKGQVDFAQLTVELEPVKQDRVLGPVGYVWEGAVWCVKKLFVWKDASYVEQ